MPKPPFPPTQQEWISVTDVESKHPGDLMVPSQVERFQSESPSMSGSERCWQAACASPPRACAGRLCPATRRPPQSGSSSQTCHRWTPGTAGVKAESRTSHGCVCVIRHFHKRLAHAQSNCLKSNNHIQIIRIIFSCLCMNDYRLCILYNLKIHGYVVM